MDDFKNQNKKFLFLEIEFSECSHIKISTTIFYSWLKLKSPKIFLEFSISSWGHMEESLLSKKNNINPNYLSYCFYK